MTRARAKSADPRVKVRRAATPAGAAEHEPVREGPDQPGVVGRLVVQQVLQPGCQSLQVLVACGQDAGADQHVPDIAQRLGLWQIIEQVVGDRVACPGQAAEQPGRPALAQPGHHGSGVGDRGERREQRMQLG